MAFRRVAWSLLLAAIALFATASPALAHAALKSSNPAQGATLATAPQQIELTFAEAVTLPADPVVVTGPDGTKWAAGQPTVSGAKITVPVQPAGPAGAYTVAWKVISDDGDSGGGTIHFTLTAPASTPASSAAPTTTTTAAAAAAPSSQAPVSASAVASEGTSGFPAWAWILIVAVVVVAIVGLLVARSRRATPPDNS